MAEKYKYLIQQGVEQALEHVQAHHAAPLSRFVLMQQDAVQGDGGIRIVTHIISDLPTLIPPYCDLHWHEFDEINLIISDKSLRYKIRLEDEEYEVESPCTVYIPKGVRHAAEVLSGTGVFVAITFTKEYRAFQ